MKITDFIRLYKMKRTNTISSKAMIANNVSISNSKIGRYANLAHDAAIVNSEIGDRTSIGRYSNVRYSEVGKFCTVSWNVTIGADGHPIDRLSGNGSFFQKRFGLCQDNSSKGDVPRTRIGNDVWIGCNAIIKSGVTVGDGAVIGAGAVVLKDVLPFEIVGGVPAKHIKFRFDDDKIKKLQELCWWDFTDDKLKENIELFQAPLTNEKLDCLIKKQEISR